MTIKHIRWVACIGLLVNHQFAVRLACKYL